MRCLVLPFDMPCRIVSLSGRATTAVNHQCTLKHRSTVDNIINTQIFRYNHILLSRAIGHQREHIIGYHNIPCRTSFHGSDGDRRRIVREDDTSFHVSMPRGDETDRRIRLSGQQGIDRQTNLINVPSSTPFVCPSIAFGIGG